MTLATALRRDIVVPNRKGLHARASAKFVRCAEGFDANIRVTFNGHTVPATSIMGLMTLGAVKGATIVLEAEGRQAAEALDALTTLIADRFGEPE